MLYQGRSTCLLKEWAKISPYYSTSSEEQHTYHDVLSEKYLSIERNELEHLLTIVHQARNNILTMLYQARSTCLLRGWAKISPYYSTSSETSQTYHHILS